MVYRKNKRAGKNVRVETPIVQQHILLLLDSGISFAAMSRMSGVPQDTIRRWIGKGGKNRGIPKTVKGDLARSILSLKIKEDDQVGMISVDLTSQRLRCLLAAGYPMAYVRKLMCGKVYAGGDSALNGYIFNPGRYKFMRENTAREIKRLYDGIGFALADSSMGIRKSSISRSRNMAIANGWVIPAMWDDPGVLGGPVENDKPYQLEPSYVDFAIVERVADGDENLRRQMNSAERIEVVRLMLSRGHSHNHVVNVLKLSSQTFKGIMDVL